MWFISLRINWRYIYRHTDKFFAKSYIQHIPIFKSWVFRGEPDCCQLNRDVTEIMWPEIHDGIMTFIPNERSVIRNWQNQWNEFRSKIYGSIIPKKKEFYIEKRDQLRCKFTLHITGTSNSKYMQVYQSYTQITLQKKVYISKVFFLNRRYCTGTYQNVVY